MNIYDLNPQATAKPSIRVGMITPSTNTVLEPMSYKIINGRAISLHFSRIEVTRIEKSSFGDAQFSKNKFIESSQLLIQTNPHVVVWNGTSAAWLGMQWEKSLLQTFREIFPNHVAIVGYLESQLAIFQAYGIKSVNLVSPYTDAVVEGIIRTLQEAGIHVLNEGHLGISDNYSFAEVDSQTIVDLALKIAHPPADAMLVICTNLSSAPLVHYLESQLQYPVFDSLTVLLWASLVKAGWTDSISGWGRLLEEWPNL